MKRVRTHKPVRVKSTDQLIELRPHVYLFTPAWKAKSNAR